MSRQKQNKPLKDKPENEGLCSRRPVPLKTLANVQAEMGRMYRLALNKKVKPEEATKYVYILKEIRGCIEAELLDDVQARLAALTSKVEARRGH